MKNKILLVLTFIFLLAISSFAGIWGYKFTNQNEKSNIVPTSYFTNIPSLPVSINPDSVISENFDDNKDVSEGPIDLTAKEYRLISTEFQNIVDYQDPHVALLRLDKLMKISKKIAGSCHGLTHAIGHMGYKKFGDLGTTISYQDDVCGAGYTHGVIEGYFESEADIESKYLNICAGNDGTCVHAIGHGLMYYKEGEIPQALPFCDKFSTLSQQIYCSEGVFMENFEANSLTHEPKYLDPNNPFYPCMNYYGAYREVCLYYSGRYIVRLMKDNYAAAVNKCLESPSQVACLRGVGAVTMRQNISTPKVVEDACATAPWDLLDNCISGAVSYYLVNSRSKQETLDKMCGSFTNASYKEKCNGYVNGWPF